MVQTILLKTQIQIDTDLRIKTLVLHECPLWKNESIGRELNQEGIRLVMDDFVRSGHGEWEDPDVRTRCRILWRKPEQLASDIYDWAVANGYINSVCTVYELHSGEFVRAFQCVVLLIACINSHRLILKLSSLYPGEDVNGMSFHGVDEELLRRALGILEQQGKCTMFSGDHLEEDGIKFF